MDLGCLVAWDELNRRHADFQIKPRKIRRRTVTPSDCICLVGGPTGRVGEPSWPPMITPSWGTSEGQSASLTGCSAPPEFRSGRRRSTISPRSPSTWQRRSAGRDTRPPLTTAPTTGKFRASKAWMRTPRRWRSAARNCERCWRSGSSSASRGISHPQSSTATS